MHLADFARREVVLRPSLAKSNPLFHDMSLAKAQKPKHQVALFRVYVFCWRGFPLTPNALSSERIPSFSNQRCLGMGKESSNSTAGHGITYLYGHPAARANFEDHF